MMDIIFYNNNNGESDVENYIIKFGKNKNTRNIYYKIMQYLEQIKNNEILNNNIVKYIGNKLYEIRVNNVRLLFSTTSNEIIILHCFTKKSNKISKIDINIAIQRLKKINGGESI